MGIVLRKLKERMVAADISPEQLAAKSKEKDFSNMTIRRAIAGRGIDRLKAIAIARAMKHKLEDLI